MIRRRPLKGRRTMTNLTLSPTHKYFHFGDKDDYVVLDGGRVIGRIMLHPQAPDGHPWFWTITDPDIPPFARQTGLFNNTRRSDGGIQGAVASRIAILAEPLLANVELRSDREKKWGPPSGIDGSPASWESSRLSRLRCYVFLSCGSSRIR